MSDGDSLGENQVRFCLAWIPIREPSSFLRSPSNLVFVMKFFSP